MERDDPSEVLRRERARVDACRRDQRRARWVLRSAGIEALRALSEADKSSGQVAKAISTSGSTVRKLVSDGDRYAWSPRSRKVYAALDAYTLRTLDRTWRLTDLRDAYDQASSLLIQAEQRRNQAEAEAGGAMPTADLGILYVPGLAEDRLELPLRLFGDALITSFVTNDGVASVRVVEVQAEATDAAPARLVLEPSAGDEGTDGQGTADRRWLVAVSPVSHPVTGDAELRPFLRWLLAALPWFAADIFDRRIARARCLPRSWPDRWLRTAGNVLVGLVGIPLLLLILALAALSLAALYLPGVRAAGAAGARWLVRGLGLTYAHAAGQVSFTAQAERMRTDLDWMRRQCRHVAVVAHGQGVPVAHSLVRGQAAGSAELLVTLGSPLRRFRFARWMYRRGGLGSTLNGLVGLTTWTVTAVGRAVIVLTFAAWLVTLLVTGGPLWLTALAAVAGGLFYLSMSIFAATAGRILHDGVREVRLGAAAHQPEGVDTGTAPTSPRWLELATPTDPVADGAYLAATAPLGEQHEAVSFQASILADHVAYLKPGSEALGRLAVELEALAAAPAPVAVPDGDPAGEARRRVRWLMVARWAAGVAGLLTATAVWLTGSPLHLDGWRGAVGFGLLWLMAAVAAATVLKGLWLLWDQVERRFRPPPGIPGNSTPVHATFAFFLEVIGVIVAAPVLALLGWLVPVTRAILALPELIQVNRPTAVLLAMVEMLLASYAIAFVAGTLMARKEARDQRPPGHAPDPLEVASLLLRLLPAEGLVVDGGRYCAAPVAWDVSTRRLWRRGRPRSCPTPVRMLLRDDTVLLDLRDDCVEREECPPPTAPRPGEAGTIRVTPTLYVHGRRVYPPGQDPPGQDGAGGRPAFRLAGASDFRRFRHDLPELLRQVASQAAPPGADRTAAVDLA